MKNNRLFAIGAMTVGVLALLGCASGERQIHPEPAALAVEADRPAAPAADSEEAQSEQAGDLVCRTEPVTGSHLYRRQCYTVSELEEMQKRSREWIRSRGASGGPTKVKDSADPRE